MFGLLEINILLYGGRPLHSPHFSPVIETPVLVGLYLLIKYLSTFVCGSSHYKGAPTGILSVKSAHEFHLRIPR